MATAFLLSPGASPVGGRLGLRGPAVVVAGVCCSIAWPACGAAAGAVCALAGAVARVNAANSTKRFIVILLPGLRDPARINGPQAALPRFHSSNKRATLPATE